jgi:hypothetical protein
MQEVIVIILLVLSVLYLGYRFYKNTLKKKCGDDTNCGCK